MPTGIAKKKRGWGTGGGVYHMLVIQDSLSFQNLSTFVHISEPLGSLLYVAQNLQSLSARVLVC